MGGKGPKIPDANLPHHPYQTPDASLPDTPCFETEHNRRIMFRKHRWLADVQYAP